MPVKKKPAIDKSVALNAQIHINAIIFFYLIKAKVIDREGIFSALETLSQKRTEFSGFCEEIEIILKDFCYSDDRRKR